MVTFVNGSFVWVDPDAPASAALDLLARAPACCRRHAAVAGILGTFARVTANLPWRAPACCRRHAAVAGILGTFARVTANLPWRAPACCRRHAAAAGILWTLAHQKGSAMRVAVTLQTS